MSNYDSASESDNDAPEEVTLSSSRAATKATSKQEKALESKSVSSFASFFFYSLTQLLPD